MAMKALVAWFDGWRFDVGHARQIVVVEVYQG